MVTHDISVRDEEVLFAERPVVQAVQDSVSARAVFSRPVRPMGAGAARLAGVLP
jgi:hypothetical protein